MPKIMLSTERLITADELSTIVPFPRVHLGRLEKAGRFPRRLKIGERRVAWRLSDVLQWIEDRAEERDGAKPGSSHSSAHLQ